MEICGIISVRLDLLAFVIFFLRRPCIIEDDDDNRDEDDSARWEMNRVDYDETTAAAAAAETMMSDLFREFSLRAPKLLG